MTTWCKWAPSYLIKSCVQNLYWILCEKEHYAFVFTADYAFLILDSELNSLQLTLGSSRSLLLLCPPVILYLRIFRAFEGFYSNYIPCSLFLHCSMHKNGINLNVICEVCSRVRWIFKTEFGRCFGDAIIWLFSSAEIDSAQCAARILITNGTMTFRAAEREFAKRRIRRIRRFG